MSVLGGTWEDEFVEDKTFWRLLQVGDIEDQHQDNIVGMEMRGKTKNECDKQSAESISTTDEGEEGPRAILMCKVAQSS